MRAPAQARANGESKCEQAGRALQSTEESLPQRESSRQYVLRAQTPQQIRPVVVKEDRESSQRWEEAEETCRPAPLVDEVMPEAGDVAARDVATTPATDVEDLAVDLGTGPQRLRSEVKTRVRERRRHVLQDEPAPVESDPVVVVERVLQLLVERPDGVGDRSSPVSGRLTDAAVVHQSLEGVRCCGIRPNDVAGIVNVQSIAVDEVALGVVAEMLHDVLDCAREQHVVGVQVSHDLPARATQALVDRLSLTGIGL